MALYKRKNSKFYWAKFTFDGVLRQFSTKCKNRRDAETVESALRTQLALGKVGIKPKVDVPTFSSAVKEFLEFSRMERAEVTHLRLDCSFKPLLKFFGEKVKVDRIESKDIEKYILARKKQISRKTKLEITRESINREIGALKMLFRRLADSEIILKNPLRTIKRLPENERQFHVITEAEEKRYRLAAPPMLSDVFGLMIETGLRCGEAYRLKQSEIFLDDGYLKVTKSKTKSSIRRVPLSEKAAKILAARIKRFDGENIFPQNDIDGEKVTRNLIKEHLETVRALGFDFRLYDTRHTFASRAVESGVDLVVLAAILGHANLKMMMRYVHPSEKHKADAIRQMEKRKAKAV